MSGIESAIGFARRLAMIEANRKKREKPYDDNPGRLLSELKEGAEQVLVGVAAEKAHRADWADAEYWACIVFQSSEQKEAVLKVLGVEVRGGRFVNGNEFIEKLALDVPKEEHIKHRMKSNKVWGELT
jgi:hypothetical protein